ncbi:MAG: glycosyltransferase family 4 protein, partial [Solirubrobacterales bacterium]|nr:glycosyltransferase family 4 protein [Solirubrobacterales bacterium]
MGLRCAIIPPTPVPYREPLFRALSERPELEIRVIYQSAQEPSWDVPADWFPRGHPYPAVHLRAWQRRRAGRTPVVLPRGLERALRRANPDCVVVWEYGAASLRTLAWCRRHRRRYLIFTECTPEIDGLLPPWQLALHRRLARQADGVIAASSAARRRLRGFGVPDDRITVALQAADVAPFRAAGRENGRGPVTVISAGRLVPDKNFGRLIEAFGRLRSEAELEIVGTGFLGDELKRLAARHGVAVRFRGHARPPELPSLYATADVYALISTYEPFGVAVREAAAAGLPIICSRTAGAAGD